MVTATQSKSLLVLIAMILVNKATVEPRFTNLIRPWRPFVNLNVRKPKLS
jgi:hypothetical protein